MILFLNVGGKLFQKLLTLFNCIRSRCWKFFSRDSETLGTSDAPSDELGVRAALPFPGPSLVSESAAQGEALHTSLDLRIKLKTMYRG